MYNNQHPQTLNYLAHIFLSNHQPQRQIGNFIGDFVKGRRFEDYPTEIRQGIVLHRHIDSYTDAHPVVKSTIELMRPTFGRYSGIVLDLYFDHFLATNFNSYSPNRSLANFSIRFYASSILHYKHLPIRVQGFIWHFITTNRLGKYKSIEGLKNSLQIMERHKTPAISPEAAIVYLKTEYQTLERQFHLFFPDLVNFVLAYEQKL